MIHKFVGVTVVSAFALASSASAQWATFVNATSTRLPTGAGQNDPALSTTDPEEKEYAWGDVDKDGDLDLVCVRKQPFTSTGKRPNVLFMNEGIAQGHAINGVFMDRTAQYASASTIGGDQGFLTPTNDRDVVLTDVNNDTWLDIVTAPTLTDNQAKHLSHPRVYINRGEIRGVWQGFRYEDARIPEMHATSGPRFCSVAAGDVTGDGYVDLYFGDYDSGGAEAFDYNNKLLVNKGKINPGVFEDSGTTRMSANPGLLSAFGAASVIADMNNDGALDVVKQTSLNAPLHVAIQHNNPANIGFFPDSTYKIVSETSPYFVSTGDLNNDGRLDMVISSDGADHYLLNTGNAANGSANFTTINFSYQAGNNDQGFASDSLVVDLNNDGWRDVLIADVDIDISGCGRRTHIYRNLGNAPNVTLQEQNPAVIPLDMLVGTHDIAAMDINNDGWLDLVIGRCTGTQVWMNVPPAGVVFTYPGGLPAVMPPNEAFAFDVQLNAVGGGNVAPNSGKIFISTGGPFIQSNMTALGGNLYSATLPPTACPDTVRFYFSGQLSTGGTFFDPPSAAASPYTAVASVGTEITMDDSIEGNVAGWTISNDPSVTGGTWQQATPNGTINGGVLAAPNEDATGGSKNTKCFVTENGPLGSTNPSTWDLDGGPTRLTSPAIDLTGTDATISFAAWFYTSSIASGDVMNVAVSNNGSTWVTVMNINATTDGTNTSWETKAFVVSDFVTPTSNVQVRFSASDIGAPSVVEAAIDNMRVDQVICIAQQPCPADATNDSMVNVNDLLAVINAWGTAGGPADITGDGTVNVNDLLAVINAWGPCP